MNVSRLVVLTSVRRMSRGSLEFSDICRDDRVVVSLLDSRVKKQYSCGIDRDDFAPCGFPETRRGQLATLRDVLTALETIHMR